MPRTQETVFSGVDEEGKAVVNTKPTEDPKDVEGKKNITIEIAPKLLYGVTDIPPLSVSLPFALQISTQTVGGAITISMLLSQALCAPDLVAARIMNTAVFMAGLTTFIQTTVGVRLPVFQGPAMQYAMPIITRASLPDWYCPDDVNGNGTGYGNSTDLAADNQGYISWDNKLSQVSGSLIAASLIHALLGCTGVVGHIVPFIGPLTILPALVLIAFDVVRVLRSFAEISWLVTCVSLLTVLTSSCYLARVLVPVPSWNRKSGFHLRRTQIFRPYGIIFAMIFGWVLSYILTETGVFSDDPNDLEYKARTDNRGDVVEMASWVYLPYPGQFGVPSFNAGIFLGLIIAMLTSVLDSVADYMVASTICQVDKPPPHAVNRGLFVEGVCSMLSGAFGAGHATTTYSGLIGNLSLTGIASRRVFQYVGVILMLIGIFGKFSAFLVTMPKPIIGGFGAVGISTLVGMALSSLEEIDMSRPRNVIAVGLPLVLGTMIPGWLRDNPEAINTSVDEIDQLFKSILGNGMFVGGLTGFILDNTLPGKQKKKEVKSADGDGGFGERSGVSSYELPFIGQYLRRQKWTRFIPIFPHSSK